MMTFGCLTLLSGYSAPGAHALTVLGCDIQLVHPIDTTKCLETAASQAASDAASAATKAANEAASTAANAASAAASAATKAATDAATAAFDQYAGVIAAFKDTDASKLLNFGLGRLPVDRFPILKPMLGALLGPGNWADKLKAGAGAVGDLLNSELQGAVNTMKDAANGTAQWIKTAKDKFKETFTSTFTSLAGQTKAQLTELVKGKELPDAALAIYLLRRDQ